MKSFLCNLYMVSEPSPRLLPSLFSGDRFKFPAVPSILGDIFTFLAPLCLPRHRCPAHQTTSWVELTSCPTTPFLFRQIYLPPVCVDRHLCHRWNHLTQRVWSSGQFLHCCQSRHRQPLFGRFWPLFFWGLHFCCYLLQIPSWRSVFGYFNP